MKLRKQERLTIQEAHDDILALNAGAEKFDFPYINEITQYKEVDEFSRLLEEEGCYKPFEITDEIHVGEERVALLKKTEIEKDPLEIHYLIEAKKKIKADAQSRFGLEFPEIPIERIIYAPPETFYDVYTGTDMFGGEVDKKEARKVKGVYDANNQVIVIEFQEGDNKSKRIYRAIHELTHHLLAQQKDAETVPRGFYRIFKEGATEQATIEMSADILVGPDLIEFTKGWIKEAFSKDPSAAVYDNATDILDGIPYLAKDPTSPQKKDLFVCFAYPLERMFMYTLTRKFKDICRQKKIGSDYRELEIDPLKIFVRYVAGKHNSLMHKLLRASVGEKKFEELKSQYSLSIDDLWGALSTHDKTMRNL